MSNAFLLKGNHEYMMQCCLEDPDDRETRSTWLFDNGGQVTYDAYKQCSRVLKSDILQYLQQMPLNLEVEVNGQKYLLVHGAPIGRYDPATSRYRNEEEHTVWERIRPETKVPEGKTLIFGHTPTIRYAPFSIEEGFNTGRMMSVWFGKDKIGIDCGCGHEKGGRFALRDLRILQSFFIKPLTYIPTEADARLSSLSDLECAVSNRYAFSF